jgi:4-hydroxy-tetrahydrodipicolinate synthase
MRQIFDAVQSGEVERAREIDQSIRPIYEAIAIDTNPIPVKAATELLGLIPSARMRLPMVEADQGQRGTLRKALEAQGLLAASAA